MPFPDEPLGVRVELYVSGAWLDITGDVYTKNLITISRGRPDEAARVDAGSCTFVLDNSTGRYAARNPHSDLFGLIGRNTPVRVSIQPGGAAGPRLIRFVGEVSSWPPEWDTSRFVTVSATAAGVLRRLGQGANPLASAMRREFTNPARTSIVAYWPLEDGPEATSYGSAIPGMPAMVTSLPGMKPAAYTAYTASDALPTLGEGQATVELPSYPATTETALRFFFAFPDTAPTQAQTLATVYLEGDYRWEIGWYPDGKLTLRGWRGDRQLEYVTWGDIATGSQSHVGLDFIRTLTRFDRRAYRAPIAEASLAKGVMLHYAGTETFAGAPGRVRRITLGGGAAGEVAVGHVALANRTDAYGSTGNAMVGWAGETAVNRCIRLCREEQIPFTYDPNNNGIPSEKVGAQRVASLLDLLQEAMDADGGRFYEQRDALALAARSRATLYTQRPALTLDYAAGEVAARLAPVDDDQHTHNDVIVARVNGSNARAVAETGPMSVQAPPSGVGRYDTSTTLNLFSDDQCAPRAYWELFTGTRDAPRYPSISVEVHSAPHLAEQVAAVDVGSRIVVVNPPPWLPPEQVEALAEGYTETLGVYTWDITYNASPGSLYLVARVDDDQYSRADTDGSTLATAATETATALNVQPAAGTAPWTTTPSEYPFDIAMGGEIITVTGAGPTLADTFTRTVTDGWGNADTGQPWTTTGTAADYSVTGGRAVLAMSAVNSSRLSLIPLPYADVDLYADITTTATATGAAIVTGPVLRATDNNNAYHLRIDFSTTNAITASIRKRVAGVETTLATYSAPFTHTPGTYVRTRFQVNGSTLQARIWAPNTAEPDTWQLTATDTAIASGPSIGFRTFASTGNTNVKPTVIIDNLRILNTQTLTVTRSANGIVKAHPAGTALALARTPYTAL
ncbi:hypothetical protein [Streptomyces sp. NPDC003278]|uniref:hypothetical protein n=1 Tax=Streptomyces sp. NPDC003278 TaxID=3364679 RepID=UPI0036835FB4